MTNSSTTISVGDAVLVAEQKIQRVRNFINAAAVPDEMKQLANVELDRFYVEVAAAVDTIATLVTVQ